MDLRKMARGYAQLLKLDASFASTQTGFGTSSDKGQSSSAKAARELDDKTIENLYNNNHIVQKGVEKFVDEAFREPFKILVKSEEKEDSDLGDELFSFGDDLGVWEGLREAAELQRAFRGSIVYFVTEDSGEQEEELDIETIRKIIAVRVIDRRFLEMHKRVEDPESRHMGEPEVFRIQAQEGVESALVHRSRCLIVRGKKNKNQNSQYKDWGVSVIDAAYDAVQRREDTWNVIAHLVADGDQTVIKIKGLLNTLGGDPTASDSLLGKLKSRLNKINEQRSSRRAVVLDQEMEELERQRHEMAGYEVLLQEMNQDVAAAFDTPMTVFFSQSPGGLNATGESDLTIFRNSIRGYQKRYLNPHVSRAVEILAADPNGPTSGQQPEDWTIQWESLEQLSMLEEIQARKMQGEIDEIYEGMGFPAEIFFRSRFRPSGYSFETSVTEEEVDVIAESRTRALEAEVKAKAALEAQFAAGGPPQGPGNELPPVDSGKDEPGDEEPDDPPGSGSS